MTQETSQLQQMKPYLIIAGILFVIVLLVFFWPSSDKADEPIIVPVSPIESNSIETESAVPVLGSEQNDSLNNNVQTDVFQPIQAPSEVTIGDDAPVAELEVQEIPIEEPLDTSDGSIKASLMSIAASPTFAKLLVNEGLIEKFVINVNNLADAKMSSKDALVVPPQGEFKTYRQADRSWIDAKSFQRYTPYVEALESMEVDELLDIFDTYKETIEEKFAEISRPGTNFDDSLIAAINELLDTPQVPVPIEVYSESVMYKFKEERLEALSGPQKQLIRTGPYNMRRIKDVLSDVKEALLERE